MDVPDTGEFQDILDQELAYFLAAHSGVPNQEQDEEERVVKDFLAGLQPFLN